MKYRNAPCSSIESDNFFSTEGNICEPKKICCALETLNAYVPALQLKSSQLSVLNLEFLVGYCYILYILKVNFNLKSLNNFYLPFFCRPLNSLDDFIYGIFRI